MNAEHIAILDHTMNRAAHGLYCGDSTEMLQLVEYGFMELAGRKPFVKDPYFRITALGREALAAHEPGIHPEPDIRTVPTCTVCGSSDVRRDAYAAWDPDEQEWELSSVFDSAYCIDCEGECSITWGVERSASYA